MKKLFVVTILLASLVSVGCGQQPESWSQSSTVNYLEDDIIKSMQVYDDFNLVAYWKYDKNKLTQLEAINTISMGMNFKILNYVAQQEYIKNSQYIWEVEKP